MPFEQFLDLTPREFFEGLREKEKYEEEMLTYQVRMVCETLRTQTAHLMNQQGAKVRNVKKLMKFPWERAAAKPAQTQEQLKVTMKAMAKGWVKTKKPKKDANRR